MAVKMTLRITFDIAMTILLLCAYAYRITGDKAHEWLGISVFILFIAHTIINRHWYKHILKGKYTPRRSIMSIVNIVLALDFATLFITGLLHSRTVFVFLHLPGDINLRQIHTTAAYWGMILIAVHIGLHWGMFTRIVSKNRLIIYSMRILAFLFVLFGVWSTIDRDFFAKLFLGFSFDYWDETRPVVLFFAETLSIMGIYIFVVYYAPKAIAYFRNQHTKPEHRN